MNALTIPALKKFAKAKGHVVIPRAEYESLKAFTASASRVKTVKPTTLELRAFAQMHKNRADGKTLSLDELKARLKAKSIKATASEMRAIAQARKDLKAGALLTYGEFSRRLEAAHTKRR